MSEIQHGKSCHLRHKPIIQAPRGTLAIVWIYVELIQKVIEDLVSNAVIVENLLTASFEYIRSIKFFMRKHSILGFIMLTQSITVYDLQFFFDLTFFCHLVYSCYIFVILTVQGLQVPVVVVAKY